MAEDEDLEVLRSVDSTSPSGAEARARSSQTRSTNPFRPGSGILPPLLAGREHETAIFQGRIERTRQGQPEHTALLGDWAIGKTTLLMHWRRLLRHAGDAVVLTMAYPLTPDQFLSSLVVAIEAELATD